MRDADLAIEEVRVGLPAGIRRAVEVAAAAAGQSLSAWLTEAAARRLKVPVPARRPRGRPKKPSPA